MVHKKVMKKEKTIQLKLGEVLLVKTILECGLEQTIELTAERDAISSKTYLKKVKEVE
jgi:hypothetical protein